MSILTTRRLSALLISSSVIALSTAHAGNQLTGKNPFCNPDTFRPCGALLDNSTVEVINIEPNLEFTSEPVAAEPFRISVDGQPLEGAQSSEADVRRSQDVEAHKNNIDIRFDSLKASPMLSVVASQPAVHPGEAIRFYTHQNYAAFIEQAELQIFADDSNRATDPLVTIPVVWGKPVVWTPTKDQTGKLRFVLHVEDGKGRVDETTAQEFLVTEAPTEVNRDIRTGPLLENQRTTANIPVNGGTVIVTGSHMQAGERVSAFGIDIPVADNGRFILTQIVPADQQTVTVTKTTADGSSTDISRDFERVEEDKFFVGIVDITGGYRERSGNAEELHGETYDPRDDYIDGRIAFYYKGKIRDGITLTASADTGEHPIEDLFDQFGEKDPRSLLRRLDEENHYPVYGDDSTTYEDAPTYGRFYVRGETENGEAMWGNFKTELPGNELMRFQRGLYGAKAEWHDIEITSFGEQRTRLVGFAADPGTIGSREDFLSTGGSVYYFRNQDIVPGSERVFVEIRDRDSGLVLERQELIGERDYEVNYLQGRVLLREALSITADRALFVRNSSLAGNPVHLVVHYEYSTGLTAPDTFTFGGRASHWFGDNVKVGVTGYDQGEDQAEQTLLGGDITLRHSENSYVKAEYANSDGAGNPTLLSGTGGYDFAEINAAGGSADAWHLEFAADLSDFTETKTGKVTGYWKERGAGFSGPGELVSTQAVEQTGLQLDSQLSDRLSVKAKLDNVDGGILKTDTIEAGIDYKFDDHWYSRLGVRMDDRSSGVVTASPTLNQTGERTDAALQIGYRKAASVNDDERSRAWELYAFGQQTLDRDGTRQKNDRYGVGGNVQATERLALDAEFSEGDGDLGAELGLDYKLGERGSIYTSYALANELPDSFNTGRLGRLTSGTKYRFADNVSVFAEGRFTHGAGPTGMTQAYGVDFTPIEGLALGVKYETGDVSDPITGDIERNAYGASVDYSEGNLRFSNSLEYRTDEGNLFGNRRTWASRHVVGYQTSDDWRVFAKVNAAVSQAELDETLDAEYVETSFAGAYRPVDNDRFNGLVKYTYLYDLPSAAQITGSGQSPEFTQRSHVFAIDGTYQLTDRFALGGKVAHRFGELKLTREDLGQWFDSTATFWAVRGDYRIIKEWDGLAEIRSLSVSEAEDQRVGGLVAIYRHFGPHIKGGAGYNFTDFSDDLTDLSYDEDGVFFNLIGKY